MANDVLFIDYGRQHEIETFFDAVQRQRNYYRNFPNSYHALTFFTEPEFEYQCPREMTDVYLSFPAYHVKYKQPAVLPNTTARTSGMPSLPDRILTGRYNTAACKAFTR